MLSTIHEQNMQILKIITNEKLNRYNSTIINDDCIYFQIKSWKQLKILYNNITTLLISIKSLSIRIAFNEA